MEESKLPKKRKISFGFIFLVLLGLSLLFVIATPSHIPYRTKGYNYTAKFDLKNFYTAAQLFFANNPKGTINMDIAKKHGYNPTLTVKISVIEGTRDKFKATAIHESGTITYTINKEGNIEP
jgi:hypothetical protein